MSVRVEGTGEISPVEGMAENREFCAGACASAGSALIATRINPSAGPSRPPAAAVAHALFMTLMFSAEIAAISSRLAVCLWPR
jgi:hypothetical protein